MINIKKSLWLKVSWCKTPTIGQRVLVFWYWYMPLRNTDTGVSVVLPVTNWRPTSWVVNNPSTWLPSGQRAVFPNSPMLGRLEKYFHLTRNAGIGGVSEHLRVQVLGWMLSICTYITIGLCAYFFKKEFMLYNFWECWCIYFYYLPFFFLKRIAKHF